MKRRGPAAPTIATEVRHRQPVPPTVITATALLVIAVPSSQAVAVVSHQSGDYQSTRCVDGHSGGRVPRRPTTGSTWWKISWA